MQQHHFCATSHFKESQSQVRIDFRQGKQKSKDTDLQAQAGGLPSILLAWQSMAEGVVIVDSVGVTNMPVKWFCVLCSQR
jgi:hypothetical protein